MLKRLFILLLMLGMVACASGQAASDANTPVPTPTAAFTIPEFTSQIIPEAFKQLNLDASQVSVVSVEEVMWPDSCLGVQIKNMMCLEVITPGYNIVLKTPQGTYELHTNKEGTSYRLIPVDTSAKSTP